MLVVLTPHYFYVMKPSANVIVAESLPSIYAKRRNNIVKLQAGLCSCEGHVVFVRQASMNADVYNPDPAIPRQPQVANFDCSIVP